MPRAVYRVSIELIHSDAGETLSGGSVPTTHEAFSQWEEDHDREIGELEQLRARIMGTPGLVKYPKDVTAVQSWGKELRRGPTVMELDVDRATEDEKGADRACLMQMVDFLTLRAPIGTAYWDKAEPGFWPACVGWQWDGSEESTATIKRDVERLVPGTKVRVDGEDEDSRLALVIDLPTVIAEDPSVEITEHATNGWIAFIGHYIVVIDGLVRTWDTALFEQHFTPTRPPAEVATATHETGSHAQAFLTREDEILVKVWHWDGSLTYEQIHDDIRNLSPAVSVREYRERVVDAPIELLIDVPTGGAGIRSLHCKVGDYIVWFPDNHAEVYPVGAFNETFRDPTAEPEQLRLPQDWCNLKAMTVIDPDGWMNQDPKSWEVPITEAEFDRRAAESTVM